MKSYSFLKIGIIVVIVSLFTSCTVYKYTTISKEEEYKKEYVGKSHNEIVTTLGAPDKQFSDGAEGIIIIYENSVFNSNINTYKGSGSATTIESKGYMQFFINKSGICYDVKTNHTETIEEIDEEATKGNHALGAGFVVVSFIVLLWCINVF
ncbi:MAG: hypothetical protein J6U84_08040 [Bacteroidales bacterium]|nr:hypothetical protein [Bacteroidales bacterium]